MPTFSSATAFSAYIKTVLRRGMKEVGKNVVKVVKRRIVIDVYGAGTPTKYQRTFQLRDSVTHTSPKREAEGISVQVYHDTSKIDSAPDQFIHGSNYWSPRDYSQYLPETVHYGRSGSLFGYGFWTEERPYMTNAIEEIRHRNIHVVTLKRSLRSQGVEVL